MKIRTLTGLVLILAVNFACGRKKSSSNPIMAVDAKAAANGWTQAEVNEMYNACEEDYSNDTRLNALALCSCTTEKLTHNYIKAQIENDADGKLSALLQPCVEAAAKK